MPPELRDLVQIPTYLGQRHGSAGPVAGVDPRGRPVDAPMERRTLLLFLSTSCDGCLDLWAAFAGRQPAPLPAGVDALLITRGPGIERPDAVAALAGSARVVMGDAAWTDYEVHSGPFFVLVDAGRVLTEGVAWSVGQIRGAVEAATAG
jgi:hypothetical protein